jgi:hypothetical protein
MNNNFYRAINLVALIVVCYYLGAGVIGLLGYLVSCILMWNVLEGVRVVEVKQDDYTAKCKDVSLGIKDLKIYSLESLVKSQDMVIEDLKGQVERLENKSFDKIKKYSATT